MSSGAATGAALTAPDTAESWVAGAVAGSADAEVVAAGAGGVIWIPGKPWGRVPPVTSCYHDSMLMAFFLNTVG